MMCCGLTQCGVTVEANMLFMICCSLTAVPNKSQALASVTSDAEKPLPEDEEKLITAAEDSES